MRKYPIGPVIRHLGGECGNYRSGRQKIRCINPSHNDQRPSASVDFVANRFTCFGCGLSGDAIDLLRTVEGLSFDAAVTLAESLTGGAGDSTRDEPVEARGLFDRPRSGRRG